MGSGTGPGRDQKRADLDQVRGGPMAGRTVLVTGGTGGIGRATALGLAAMGAHLAITGRDRGRAEAVARDIRAAGGGQVDVFVADLSSQAEVRRLAGEVLQRLSRIDVLLNNAGGYWNTRHITADGLERTFAVNHLAPFLLTSLLLDRLNHSAPARVITVSSNVHAIGRIDFGDGAWGLCRASNTGPVLVLRFEARDEARRDAIRREVEDAVASAMRASATRAGEAS